MAPVLRAPKNARRLSASCAAKARAEKLVTYRPNKRVGALLGRAQTLMRKGLAHDALQMCDRAALQGEAGRYLAAMLRGDILLELGDARGALSSYDSVAKLGVADPELDCARGLALLELVRLPEARNALLRAVRDAPELAQAHDSLGLISELLKSGEHAQHYRKAKRLDPKAFASLHNVGVEEFGHITAEAFNHLPKGVAAIAQDMTLLATSLPEANDLLRYDPPISPCAFGMLVGVLTPQDVPSGLDVAQAPPQSVGILLFKRNLERGSATRRAMILAIARTIEHLLEDHRHVIDKASRPSHC